MNVYGVTYYSGWGFPNSKSIILLPVRHSLPGGKWTIWKDGEALIPTVGMNNKKPCKKRYCNEWKNGECTPYCPVIQVWSPPSWIWESVLIVGKKRKRQATLPRNPPKAPSTNGTDSTDRESYCPTTLSLPGLPIYFTKKPKNCMEQVTTTPSTLFMKPKTYLPN